MSKDKIIQNVEDVVRAHAPTDMAVEVSMDDDQVYVTLDIGSADQAMEFEALRMTLETEISALKNIKRAHIILTANNAAPQMPASKPKMKQPPVRENLKPPQIKHMIAVASGKGGVGKSTVAVNIARAMAKQGLRVGIMDADIYGPSVPTLLGVAGRKAVMNEGKVVPIEAEGMPLISIGFLVDQDQPLIWRGPMIQSAIRQFLQDVEWPALDVLVVDMPPGTGDAQLTFAQKVPLDGAVIVSTPQDIALIDARRGIEMFKQTNVLILGLIENMSYFACEKCEHENHIFGHGTMQAEADSYNLPLLGSIPLSIDIRMNGDEGKSSDVPVFEDIAAQLIQAFE